MNTQFLQPEITHSPYLYPLVAVMLHYISDDAECYACVDAMLHPRQKAIRRLYMSETRGAWLASADVVRHLLLKRVVRQVHINRENISTS